MAPGVTTLPLGNVPSVSAAAEKETKPNDSAASAPVANRKPSLARELVIGQNFLDILN